VAPAVGQTEEAQKAWSAPESETLAEGMCYFAPESGEGAAAGISSLVIFLHSLVAVDSDWQWEQQRLMIRTARASNFAVLMPRGLPGIGPGRAPNVLAWPGSPAMQEAHEAEILAAWDRARGQVERRRKARFDHVFVFGFSNGAYYTTSLAVREAYPADGYGIFAGGSGSAYNRLLAGRAEKRSPVFVGYGTKDPAREHMNSLVRMLGDLHWRHAVKRAPIGHWVSDAQLQSAIRFLKSFD
jgi:predicted esterase